MAEKNIYHRLLDSKKALLGVKWEKDQSNPMFRSVSIDQMKQHIEKAQTTAGIVAVGPFIDVEWKNVEGQKTTWWYVSGTLRYVNVDNPADVVEYESYGEANDNGDKGLNKAITAFWKNHYKVLYNIAERGDDVDSYYDVSPFKAPSKAVLVSPPRSRPAEEKDPFEGFLPADGWVEKPKPGVTVKPRKDPFFHKEVKE